jgi:uncharacterized repeat protein (TIGR03803 family)
VFFSISEVTWQGSAQPTLEHAMKHKTLVCFGLIAIVTSIPPSIHAQTFTVIHAFMDGLDGAYPQAGVTLRAGNLYGTTSMSENRFSYGFVYELVHMGNTWVTTPIHAFSGSDGSIPLARVVFGPDGNLYGTTSRGGSGDSGTVFELIAPRALRCKTFKTPTCNWTENVIREFSRSDPNDGYGPYHGDLVWDQAGNMYGMTQLGFNGYGTVFELQPTENGWKETPLLYPGYDPWGGPTLDNNNHLFGTTLSTTSGGTIFGMTYNEGMGWQQSYSYVFQDDSNGSNPNAGLVADKSGNFYGSTSTGGSSDGGGGTIFELSPSGNTWTFTKLYTFPPDDAFCGPQAPFVFYGYGPEAALTLDDAGNLYGTAVCDGAYGYGSVFKLTNTVNGWVYSSIHDFTGDDGAYPISSVTIDTDGTLYGTASEGGPRGRGVVWMIKP